MVQSGFVSGVANSTTVAKMSENDSSRAALSVIGYVKPSGGTDDLLTPCVNSWATTSMEFCCFSPTGGLTTAMA
jgi:hypothetical protein